MLLNEWRVYEFGSGRAVRVAGRLLADLGAQVFRSNLDPAHGPLDVYLNHAKTALAPSDLRVQAKHAQLLILDPSDASWGDCAWATDTDAEGNNDGPTIVRISPYGAHGPNALRPASDLTLLCASGISKLLTGQVTDLSEAPTIAAGEQSAFIAGVAAACSGVLHHLGQPTSTSNVDISAHEALATLAIQELSQASLHGTTRSRHRVGDGNGSTVCILPTNDGYAAISPREERQWAQWLTVMGSPAWGQDPRFADKTGRAAHWDEVHALMAQWSRTQTKQALADAAQAAHVPSFPLCAPLEHLASSQLKHRGYFSDLEIDGETYRVPGSPFGISLVDAPANRATAQQPRQQSGHRSGQQRSAHQESKPLSGVRVLDFSWVIAGPTTTRYLAAMGADVIKIEAPGKGDPGRTSELHTVLGQGKRAIVLDLKTPEGVETAQRLVASSDVLIENFATGVMERFGLGAQALHAAHPALIYVSASGMGRTGPQAKAVAYGTLLQCFSGFAELNVASNIPPRVGMAWLDPMCGLMLAMATAAALAKQRATGQGVRVDFSMVEAMLWTMAKPLLDAQARTSGVDAASDTAFCGGIFPASAQDTWVGISVTNSAQRRALQDLLGGTSSLDSSASPASLHDALAAWTSARPGSEIEANCRALEIPCASVVGSLDLLQDQHLLARGFWESTPDGRLPGLPWRSDVPRELTPAPALGQHNEEVAAQLP
ncbi:MAG: crotonobetainyl-CoA:carnitine CoA-transferase CaiB-like acyl-CoA transferase [Gammaproteobacteria bacterium]|jgi:crotonobetainyl-CoA:carnitine CoA-transferase CaiB-like acyl-CoA transferase